MPDPRLRPYVKLLPLQILSALLVSYLFLHSGRVTAQVSQSGKVRELQQQRLATLRDLVKTTREHYNNGEVSSDELLSATRQEMEAELELCASNKERIAVLERVLAGAKALEEQAAKLAANKLLSKRALLKATADRLQQEILLEQARTQ